ncbi:InlB B-repeat-containing protein [Neobacillus cucumis]|nr:InlB B-repeat-containing protein [Neobacillus cucumis]
MHRKSFMMFMVFLLMLGSVPANLIQSAHAEAIQQSEVPAGYIPIYTAEDLNTVRTNLSGKYIIMNDIDLTEATAENGAFYNEGAGWIPIGTDTSPFTGTFDGNGHEIIGLNQSIKSDKVIYAGLFGYVKNGKILNLGMVNSKIEAENTSLDSATSQTYAGGIVGYGYNVTITGSYNSGNVASHSLFDGYAGGVAGYVSSVYNAFSTISNSYNSGTIQGKSYTGGIAGQTYRTQISNVYNTADLNPTESKYTGGIAGYLSSSSTVSDANNKGNIQYQYRGGGIAGYASSSSSIKNSSNEGDLIGTASSSIGGGIIGDGYTVTIGQTYNNGDITSTAQSSYGGGIAGSLGSNSSISESYNNGEINVQSYAGGIAGTMYSSVISQVYNTGTISGLFSGGIVSYSSSLTILNSFNIGTLKARSDMGGIVAIARSGTSIKNTYNVGLLQPASSTYIGNKGGIVGENEGIIENSYYLDKAGNGVGTGTTDGTIGLSFEQMKDSATYQGFDFNSVWHLDTNSEFLFPSLAAAPGAESERNIDVSIASLPEKLKYIEGEELDLTGAKLDVKTNHGNSKVIDVSKDMVTGFDSNSPGNQTETLKVTYDGLTATFVVKITAKYTVTFVDYDGTVLKREEVVDGGSATAPEVPVHEGRTFDGWDTDFTNVRDYLYIKAKYTVHSYTVTYRDGDSILWTETYKYGDKVSEPQPPVKSGYAFLNWYKDQEFQNLYSFSDPVNTDENLYGKFAKIPDRVENIVVKPNLDYAKVTWSPVNGADGYSVWWTDSPNEYFYGTYISADTTENTISGLTPGKTYYFKVTAYRMVDGRQIDSPDSKLVSGRTYLAGVTNPKAAAVGSDKVKLTWGQSADATGYEIYRADSSNGSYSKVATITESYTLSYLNTGLLPGRTYYYKTRAYRELDGSKYYSEFSTVVSANPIILGVTAKAAVASYDKMKLSWNRSPEATGYEIYRAYSATGSYSKIVTITNNSTVSYTNSGLLTGKRYYYKIRAYRTISGKNYYSTYSGIVNGMPVLSGTAAKAASAGYNKVKISWKPVSGANGYLVYRATSKTGTYSTIKTSTSSSTVSYTNTSLTSGKTYYYKVRAYRVVSGNKVYGTYSNIASAKPILAAPIKISLAKASSTAIKVSWSKVSEASGYEIYRSTNKTGTYARIKTITSASTTSYKNSSLTKRKTYYYKVRAYKVVRGKKIYSSYTTIASYKL